MQADYFFTEILAYKYMLVTGIFQLFGASIGILTIILRCISKTDDVVLKMISMLNRCLLND
jgi:hypothetical protein